MAAGQSAALGGRKLLWSLVGLRVIPSWISGKALHQNGRSEDAPPAD